MKISPLPGYCVVQTLFEFMIDEDGPADIITQTYAEIVDLNEADKQGILDLDIGVAVVCFVTRAQKLTDVLYNTGLRRYPHPFRDQVIQISTSNFLIPISAIGAIIDKTTIVKELKDQ